MTLRMLFLSTYYKPAYRYGGTVSADSGLCEALVRNGIDIDVFTTNANGDGQLDVSLEKPIDVGGVKVYYFPIDYKTYFYSSKLAKAIKLNLSNYEIIVIQALWGHPFIIAADECVKSNTPYIVPLHGQLLPWSISEKRIKKQLYLNLIAKKRLNKSAALHCTHESELENLSILGINTPAFVIPNGLDTRRFTNLPERGKIRNAFGISLDDIVLLLLGRLHHKKRPDIAFSTFVAAQKEYENVHLLIAGPDEEGWKPRLLGEASKFNLSDRIHFTGLLEGDEILNAYADADLLLMPSEPQSENFGMSAVEAMAAGLPILVSEGVPVGLDAEIAGAGRVVPCDEDAFAKVSVEMLADNDQLNEMGHMGQSHAKAKYDSIVVAKQMLAQYRSIIQSGKPLEY